MVVVDADGSLPVERASSVMSERVRGAPTALLNGRKTAHDVPLAHSMARYLSRVAVTGSEAT